MGSSGDNRLTHFDEQGNAVMVDVGDKADTHRQAEAKGTIRMSPEAFRMVQEGSMAKGDVLGVARIAGIMAAKKVDQLIPLTHPLMINKVGVAFVLHEDTSEIEIRATVGVLGKTGVEMEALTAVSVAALTIYDMCKAVDKTMTIDRISLDKKTGGKSGTYIRE